VNTIREILVDSERRLHRAGIDSASVESAELMSFVMGVPRNRLLLQDTIDEDDRVSFERLMAKRLNRVPLQHLVGTAPFRHIELRVGPGVFIPRPESELVTEAAIRHLRNCESPRAFDLCSGSGAIAISLATEVPGTAVAAVELSTDALPWLEENVRNLPTEVPVAVIAADATDMSHVQLRGAAGTCDVVTCNPPYIPNDSLPRDPEVRDHEPAMALYGGPDGLDVIRKIAITAGMLLKSGGLLVIEHADVQGPDSPGGGVVGVVRNAVVPEGMAEFIAGVAGSPLFVDVEDRQDYNQLPRFTLARRV
jgi:release factor glutamine methyltransferase